MENGRYVTLTEDQAKRFWGILNTEVKELIEAILPNERIIGIGSFGSPKPEDQRILFIEKK